MKLRKSLLIGMTTLMVATGLVGCGQKDATDTPSKEEVTQETKNNVIAVVGEEEILQDEIDSQMEFYINGMKAQYGAEIVDNPQFAIILEQQKAYTIKTLVETELLKQKAIKLGYAATDEEVNKEFESGKAGFSTLEDFENALKNNGYTEETYKERIADGLVINRLISEYTDNVTVTDDDVKAYYDENQARFTRGAGAEISHILVPTEEEATNIRKEYEEGTSFADLAGKYGTDGTKTRGGQLGYIAYETTDYDQDFMAGAKELKEGEVSQPVKTQFGFHLILAENIQAEPVVEDYENVKVMIHEELLNLKKNEALAAKIAEIEKEIPVKYTETTEEKAEETEADQKAE